ncbi:MAG: UxaA family hydrolase [Haloarculaceae archaeon]
MKGEVLDGAALRMTPEDTVATALEDLEAGRRLTVEGRTVELSDAVPFGHKFALRAIEEGEEVTKYGYVIGRAAEPVAPGDWVHVHNVESTRGRGDIHDRGGEPA